MTSAKSPSRMARKPRTKTARVLVYCNEATRIALDKWVARMDSSRSRVIDGAIQEWLAAREAWSRDGNE